MSKLRGLDQPFNGRHFDRDVIVLCVRWYLRYKLSLRDLVVLGFKCFRNAAVTISGIELTHRIRKAQFDLTNLRLKDITAPAVWKAVFSAR